MTAVWTILPVFTKSLRDAVPGKRWPPRIEDARAISAGVIADVIAILCRISSNATKDYILVHNGPCKLMADRPINSAWSNILYSIEYINLYKCFLRNLLNELTKTPSKLTKIHITRLMPLRRQMPLNAPIQSINSGGERSNILARVLGPPLAALVGNVVDAAHLHQSRCSKAGFSICQDATSSDRFRR